MNILGCTSIFLIVITIIAPFEAIFHCLPLLSRTTSTPYQSCANSIQAEEILLLRFINLLVWRVLQLSITFPSTTFTALALKPLHVFGCVRASCKRST